MKRLYSAIAAALLISLFIYLFYRSERTIINQLAILILSEDFYEYLRVRISHSLPLNEAVVFSLPGGLWVFSATVLARNLYFTFKEYEVCLLSAPILFALGLELCQLLNFTNGTFDLRDVLFYLSFWLPAAYPSPSRITQENILAPFSLNSMACVACFLSVFLAHVAR